MREVGDVLPVPVRPRGEQVAQLGASCSESRADAVLPRNDGVHRALCQLSRRRFPKGSQEYDIAGRLRNDSGLDSDEKCLQQAGRKFRALAPHGPENICFPHGGRALDGIPLQTLQAWDSQ